MTWWDLVWAVALGYGFGAVGVGILSGIVATLLGVSEARREAKRLKTLKAALGIIAAHNKKKEDRP
jgi:hypothetical protein